MTASSERPPDGLPFIDDDDIIDDDEDDVEWDEDDEDDVWDDEDELGEDYTVSNTMLAAALMPLA